MTVSTIRLAAWTVSSGLPGVEVPWPGEPLADHAWERLLRHAVDQRVTGHLHAAVEGGGMPATGAQRQDALHTHERALALDLCLERALLETVDLLESRGIEVRVLKGAALAHLAYPDPSLRSFGDVDILVREGEFDASADLLARAGCLRRFAEPRRGFTARFGKAACYVTPHGLEIDLHRSLADGPYAAAIDSGDLFRRPADLVLGGSALKALPADLAFLHACIHAALGDPRPRLTSLRDVAQTALFTAPDWESVRATAARWRCTATIRRAADLTEGVLGVSLLQELPPFIGEHAETRFETWAMASYTTDRSYPGQAVAGLWAQKRMRDRLAYARAMLLPDRAYLAGREKGYLRRAGRGLVLAARSRPR